MVVLGAPATSDQVRPASPVRVTAGHEPELHGTAPSTKPTSGDANVTDSGEKFAGTGVPVAVDADAGGCVGDTVGVGVSVDGTDVDSGAEGETVGAAVGARGEAAADAAGVVVGPGAAVKVGVGAIEGDPEPPTGGGVGPPRNAPIPSATMRIPAAAASVTRPAATRVEGPEP